MALQQLPKRALCASAVVLALTGCSSAPKDNGTAGGLQSVGSALAEIGGAVVDISATAVSKSATALGFDRRDEDLGITSPTGTPTAVAGTSLQRLELPQPDAVDLAMAEPDNFQNPGDYMSASTDPLATGDVLVSPVTRTPIGASEGEALELDPDLYGGGYTADPGLIARAEVLAPAGGLNAADSAPDFGSNATMVVAAVDPALGSELPEGVVVVKDASGKTVLLAPSDAVAAAAPQAPAAAEPVEQVATADYLHEVSAGESLWEIAQKTTGDANNWHIVADVNELPLQHQLLPGQVLVIPADLVKPGLAQLTLKQDATQSAGSDLTPPSASVEAVQAAATPAPAMPANSADDMPTTGVIETANATEVTLEDGETLWNLAKRATGDATHWRVIARHNLLDEAAVRRLRPGQVLYVPNELMREGGPAPMAAAQSAAPVDPVKATAPTPTNSNVAVSTVPTVLETAAIKAEAASEEDLTIVEATYQADTGNRVLPADATGAQGNAPTSVRISGTYYPKAIYNDADFSASLLTRVSPGTELKVTRAMGQWFEVNTPEGVGYVHARDIK